jgi:hypoxanthine-guanine phosphoribosyltransferase
MLAPVSERLRRYLGDVILSREEITKATKALASKIEDCYLPGDFGFSPLLPLSTFFAQDLLRRIRIPALTFPCMLVTQVDGLNSEKINARAFNFGTEQYPTRMLLVATLVDLESHSLLEFAADSIMRVKGVQSVDICALVRTHDCPIETKFVGVQLTEPVERFVGYGLMYKYNFSQLPDIVSLRKEF